MKNHITLIKKNSNFKLILKILLLLILILGIIFCIWSGKKINWPDESIYINIAEKMARGLGFVNEKEEPSAFRPPGYPFILFLAFYIHGGILLAKLINVIILTLTTWILALIVREIVPSGQLFVPVFVILYPLFLYTAGMLLPQIVGSFFFILAIYLITKDLSSYFSASIIGILFGLLILTIPSFTLVLILVLVLLFSLNIFYKICNAKNIFIIFLFAVLTIGPWVVRSSLIFNSFVFISTNSGVNLLYGNSENTKYNTGVVNIDQYNEIDGLNELELDNYYKKSAIKWVTENPYNAFKLYLKKVLNYFNYTNSLSSKPENFLLAEIIIFLIYYPLLLTCIIRCLLCRRFKFEWVELFLYGLYFGNAFLSAVVYTRIRYRIPFDFILVAMASIFLGKFITNISKKY